MQSYLSFVHIKNQSSIAEKYPNLLKHFHSFWRDVEDEMKWHFHTGPKAKETFLKMHNF